MVDPLWIAASSGAPLYSANELRTAMALAMQYGGRVLGGRQGVRPGGTALDTQLSGSTITVKAGCALVDPGLTSTQGPYWVALTPDETHTLTAQEANPRKDITVLRIYDHDEDSSGMRKAISEYIVGTAAPSPSEPSVPPGAFKLSTIDVPASGGGSPTVTINYPYAVAAGGIIPFRTTTERDAASTFDGMFGYVRSNDLLYVHDGSAWKTYPDPPCAHLRQTSAGVHNISNATWTSINFDAEDHDTHNGHDTATNNSRYTAPIPGIYQLSGGIWFAHHATGVRITRWAKNGSVIVGSGLETKAVTDSGALTGFPVKTIQFTLAAGDYVQLQGWQNSGGSLSTYSDAVEGQSTMTVQWLRP